MKHLSIYISFSFILISSYSQDWTKQKIDRNDSLFAIYAWEVHDSQHGASGEITLTTKGRFKYSSYYPMGFQENSEGSYYINNDTLILTSDFQSGNMKVEISYMDTMPVDTFYTCLSFPKSQNGGIFSNSYYYINDDSSTNGHFDPGVPYNLNLLDTIKKLQVKFYNIDCSSAWVPIKQINKFIKVTLLIDKYFDDRHYKVLNGRRFKIQNDKLLDLSKKK